MPRRRMIDPDFWRDSRSKKLPPIERLFFLGMVSHADDEGRLLADPAFLRSIIFPYDDFNLEDIKSMRDHILETNPNLQLYQNSGEEYLYFRRWSRYQKPSHPQPSKLPKPPELQEPIQEPIQESIPEQDQPQTGTIPSQSRSGQSSLGKVRLGKVRGVPEDFTEFLSSEKDLIDFLRRTLTKYISAGRAQVLAGEGGLGGGGLGELSPEQEAMVKANWGIAVLEKCWKDGVGENLPNAIFDGARKALKQYPLEVAAKAFAKGVRYKGGKHRSWKYFQVIIDEEMEKRGRSPPH